MDISTRLLGVSAELIMVPAEIEDKKCRAIFDKISDTHSLGSFLSMPDGSIQMSSKKQKPNFIRYIIMKDRVVLAYEYCENSLNYFQGLMSDFMGAFSGVTGIGLFLMQGITIRKLVNIAGIDDSRDFMIKKVFSLKEENLRRFGRPLHMMGARIVFPATQDDQSTYEVKIETSLEDYKTFYLENKALYPAAMDTGKGANLGAVMNRTDEFIEKNIMGFITQFK
jgi:hypothetical protein